MKSGDLGPRTVSLMALLMIASPAGRAEADGPKPSPTATAAAPAPAIPPDLARSVQEITDAVLEHHIDPPARQQMILSGLKLLHLAAGQPAPPGLGRRASAIATPEQLAALLRESWPKTTAKPIAAAKLEEALLEGLLAPVPGNAQLMTAKESRVAEQFAGNRYVGIHVALGWVDDEKRPSFHDVFPGGPADRAGVKKGDLLEEVDGVDTKGTSLREVVDRLRGDDGTDVTIKVRTPNEAKSRTMKLTRGQLPRATIEGVRKHPSGEWKIRLDVPDPIGYLKVKEIASSTPHELRKLARQMEGEGLRALVLDLRGLQFRAADVRVHPAVLLADSLLESGTIGRVRTVRGETTYQADPDALFRGWPIAVLVDQGTAGAAEWIAAALQDNHRAVVVGWPTQGARRVSSAGDPAMEGAFPRPFEAVVTSTVPVGDGRWSVSLVTGYLERGDGRPLIDQVARMLGETSGRNPAAGGVQPDHLLPAPPGRTLLESAKAAQEADLSRARSDRAYAPIKPDETPRTSPTDPPLDAAVSILHRALEKP